MLGKVANGGKRTKAGILLMLALFAAGFVAMSWPTEAQEVRYRPRNLLERMFGGEEPPPRARPAPKRRLLDRLFGGGEEEDLPAENKKSLKTKSRKSASQVVRVEEPDALPKLDTARTVMVVGDFMASGLSEGMLSAYSQNPDIKVIDRSNGSSGFVRNDFYDWSTEIKTLIEMEKPAALVIMLGTNDRQQMKIGTTREAPLSDNWMKEYQLRSDALAAAIKESGLPFAWVGLPASKSGKVSSSLLAFNDVYRKSAEGAGGVFVDIWEGFVDENGAFVMNGPDMNGQPVRLRGSDGMSLSKAGKRKAAFYVEKPLNKLLGTETLPGQSPTGPQLVGPIAPANVNVDRTQPIAIDDPELDGGQVLLGSTATATKSDIRTAAEKLVVEGIAPASSPGRADDFGGVAPATAAAETARPEATATAGAAPPVTAAPPAIAPDTTTAISR